MTATAETTALTTSLIGRVRNTSLAKSNALLPLHEAVVNAIQAVDQAQIGDGGSIVVEVVRSQQMSLDVGGSSAGRPALEPITGFKVRDNGIGFTPANVNSFHTLDSDHKAELGCRGVGRLLWLKAFKKVYIESHYEEGHGLVPIGFKFDATEGIREFTPDAASERGTIVSLENFIEGYQKAAPKGIHAIAREILEHCLWYFVRDGGAPNIIVHDRDDSCSLTSLFDEYVASGSYTRHFVIKGRQFDLAGLKLSTRADRPPRLLWCAASRVVLDENLTGKIHGLHSRLKDPGQTEQYSVSCYITSDYLDENVRADRTDFVIGGGGDDELDDDEPTFHDIRKAALAQIEDWLSDALEIARGEAEDRVNSFVSDVAPRYRPLLRTIRENGVTVDPSATDRELELQLHKNLQEVEHSLIVEGHEVLEKVELADSDEYQELLAHYLNRVEEVKQTDLAAYVGRRRVILKLLERAISLDDDGKYRREEVIHQLIMPMRTNSNDLEPEAANLWIIDERLAFHNYLASDTTLKSMTITDSVSTKEPDLACLKMVDNPALVSEGSSPDLASIVVVEIKRPMRNDAHRPDQDPIDQALDYLDRIRDGKAKTATGRPIAKSEFIPGYCYVLADLTESMVRRCKNFNLQRTADGHGYFGYNIDRRAYVEVISFDGLLKAASERNRAFFDKLGLPV